MFAKIKILRPEIKFIIPPGLDASDVKPKPNRQNGKKKAFAIARKNFDDEIFKGIFPCVSMPWLRNQICPKYLRARQRRRISRRNEIRHSNSSRHLAMAEKISLNFHFQFLLVQRLGAQSLMVSHLSTASLTSPSPADLLNCFETTIK